MPLGYERIGAAYISIHADGSPLAGEVRDQLDDMDGDFERAGRRHGESHARGYDRESNRRFRDSMHNLEQTMLRHSRRFERVGNVMGRAFGRGSRNDFLNLFGGFVSLAPRLLGMFSRLGAGLGELGDRWGGMREEAGGTLGALKNLAQQGLPGLIAAAAGVALAIQGTITLMGPLGAAISLTTGLVLALAGSLAFGLVGGLVAVAGALVPFVAAIAVGAMAMAEMGKKAPAIKAIKKEFEGLQKAAANEMFGKNRENLKGFSDVLANLRPVIVAIAGAMGDLIKQFSEMGQSKAFTDLMGQLAKILPPMVTQLGQIGGKFLLGMTQAFVAAEPLITKFLGWLDQVADAFVKAGEGGKKSPLADFFKRAGDSASILWDLVKNVGESLLQLFDAGKGTGDDVLQGLADAAEDLNKWISENPDAIEQWFEDAGKLAGELGNIATKAIAFVDALDTPTSRAMLLQILSVIGDIIGVLTAVAGFVDQVNQKIIQLGTWVADQVGQAWDRLVLRAGEAKAQIIAIWQPVAAFFTGLWGGITAFFSGFIQGIKDTFLDLYMYLVGGSLIPDLVMAIVGWFARLPGMIVGVLGNLVGRFAAWVAGIPSAMRTAVTMIANSFSGLAARIIARAGNIISGFVKWVAGIPAKMRAMVTTVVSAASGWAGKIIARAGSIAAAFARWVSSLAGKARSTATSVVSAFANLAGKIISRAGSIASKFASWLASLPGKAKAIVNQITGAFSGMASKAIAKAGSLTAAMSKWASGVGARARGVADDIVAGFRGLASRIVSAIGTIIPKIKMPSIPRPSVTAIVKVPKSAAGGVFAGPQIRMIGEAGPEAVVPLSRSLSRVDPAVRALSAFAQGLTPPKTANGATMATKTIDASGWTITTPTGDPRAVASEVVNRMAAASYI